MLVLSRIMVLGNVLFHVMGYLCLLKISTVDIAECTNFWASSLKCVHWFCCVILSLVVLVSIFGNSGDGTGL